MGANTVHRRSELYEMAVTLYVRHRPAGDNWCPRCRVRLCAPRAGAAQVILAAGVDPALYDPAPRRPQAEYWSTQPTTSLPVYGDAS
jgi:hypothetical protein